MKHRFIGLALLYSFFGASLLLNSSGALFTDSASASNNTFSTAVSFATPTPSPTPITVLINEVSTDGDANVEWVELYNPNAFNVNISGWQIDDEVSSDTFPSLADLPAGGYAVIIPTSSSIAVPISALAIVLGNTTIGLGLNNPGDSVTLRNSEGTIIDAMNYGTISSVFSGGPTAPTAGQSVSRNPNGSDTDSGADWILDTSPSLGVSN